MRACSPITGSENTLTKRVALYCRVSTADKNQTVENQLRDLRAVAQRQDWEIVATFLDEGVVRH